MSGTVSEDGPHATLDDLFSLMGKAGYSVREAFGAIYRLGLNNEYEIRRFGDLNLTEDGGYLDPETGIEVDLDTDSFDLIPEDDVLIGYGSRMSIVVDGWPALDLEDIRHVAYDVGLLDYDAPLDEGATIYLLEQRAEADRRRAEADALLQGSSASRWMLDCETRDARERADRTCMDRRAR